MLFGGPAINADRGPLIEQPVIACTDRVKNCRRRFVDPELVMRNLVWISNRYDI
jgi:hypothetical protein